MVYNVIQIDTAQFEFTAEKSVLRIRTSHGCSCGRLYAVKYLRSSFRNSVLDSPLAVSLPSSNGSNLSDIHKPNFIFFQYE